MNDKEFHENMQKERKDNLEYVKLLIGKPITEIKRQTHYYYPVVLYNYGCLGGIIDYLGVDDNITNKWYINRNKLKFMRYIPEGVKDYNEKDIIYFWLYDKDKWGVSI